MFDLTTRDTHLLTVNDIYNVTRDSSLDLHRSKNFSLTAHHENSPLEYISLQEFIYNLFDAEFYFVYLRVNILYFKFIIKLSISIKVHLIIRYRPRLFNDCSELLPLGSLFP